MRYCYFIYLTICILLSSCQTKVSKESDSDYYTIEFEQCIEKEQQILLSEIADSIEYLELKTPEDIIISNITNIIPFIEDLIICGNDGGLKRGVYQFSRDGQFIRMIGGIGQSIGEYALASDVQIDQKNKEIIIVDFGSILFYDFDGNYLRSIKTSNFKTNIGISDSILWINLFPTNQFKEKYFAVAINNNGSNDTVAVATIPNPFYDTKIPDVPNYSSIPAATFYHKNGLLYFKPNHSYDTLWQISGTNKELYAYINMGKYKLPIEYEHWYSTTEFEKSSHKYWAISKMAEDDRYFYFGTETRNPKKLQKFNYILYDKKKKRGFAAKDKKDLKITDDIMGGPNVWPYWITEKYYITTIDRDELVEQIESRNYSPTEPLKSQLSGIVKNDNQIVILCHRKDAL